MDLLSATSNKQATNPAIFNTLIDNVGPEILNELHFNELAYFVAFEVEDAVEDVHKSLVTI